MKHADALRDLLHQKIEREAYMSQQVVALQKANDDLTLSRFGRWFGSSYLTVKRIISIVLAIAILILSIYLMVSPESIFDEKSTKELVEESKNEYAHFLGEMIGEAIVESVKKGKPFTVESVSEEFATALDYILRQELYAAIRFLAILLLPLVLFLLYISRLTKKMRQRNYKISEAQKLSQELILQYTQNRDHLNQEIKLLKGILQNDSGQHQNKTTG